MEMMHIMVITTKRRLHPKVQPFLSWESMENGLCLIVRILFILVVILGYLLT